MSSRTSAAVLAAPSTELPPVEVEARLRYALDRLDAARRDAVTWFAEILTRKLYLAFDCSSIQQYARERLGFSPARTAYFLRLVHSFNELPHLHRAVASGEVPWTKAREIVKVATPATEARWVEEARTVGRRELERRVAAVRGAAMRRRRSRGQEDLVELIDRTAVGDCVSESRAGGSGASPAGPRAAAPPAAGPPSADQPSAESPALEPPAADPIEVPASICLRLSPEQFARYEGLFERARRGGFRGSREELLLAGLEALAEGGVAGAAPIAGGDASAAGGSPVDDSEACNAGGSPVDDSEASNAGGAPERTVQVRAGADTAPQVGPPRSTASPGSTMEPETPQTRRPRSIPRVQIVLHQCPDCGSATLPTSRGDLPVSAATLRTLECDARVQGPEGRNRTTIPPKIRRGVLARDGHRCRAPGCRSTRFLDVHHIVPRRAGGANRADNLITLCAGCHRLVHDHPEAGLRPGGSARAKSSPG